MRGEDDVIDLVIRLARALARRYNVYPNRVRVEIDKDTEGFVFPVTTWMLIGEDALQQQTPAAAPVPVPAPAVPAETTTKPLSRIPPAIVEALEQAGKPLSVMMLQIALEDAGKRFSEEAIEGNLEKMLADGIIEHPENRPKFYQLPAESEKTEDRGGPRFSQCVADILDVLEKAKQPLTTSRIMAALARAGKEWSLSSVGSHLAELVREGTLANPEGVYPRGYRLPEWDERAKADFDHSEPLTPPSPPREETLADSIYSFVVRRNQPCSLGEILGEFPETEKGDLRSALQDLVDAGRLRFNRGLYHVVDEGE